MPNFREVITRRTPRQSKAPASGTFTPNTTPTVGVTPKLPGGIGRAARGSPGQRPPLTGFGVRRGRGR